MQTYPCTCGVTLFFGNTMCTRCKSTTALCPQCHQVCPLKRAKNGVYFCSGCQSEVRLCENYIQNHGCNQAIVATVASNLCRYCSLNTLIPDLTVAGNLENWAKLEAAKQRVLYELDQLGLPINTDGTNGKPVLRFAFKKAVNEPVFTGHEFGLITINIDEADSIERERARITLGEPQRTLIGHFRHELGHYFWDLLVNSNRLNDFRKLFGDETNPPYEQSKAKYYADSARAVWQSNFISEYAAMHPWEDFAETFAAYLDMIAVLTTARHFDRVVVNSKPDDFDAMVKDYREIGIVVNEFNRDMGLLDLVPDILSESVVNKLRFVHSLRT